MTKAYFTFSILINHFARMKQTDVALDFYERMKIMEVKPDIVIHNTIIKMHCDNNEVKKALDVCSLLSLLLLLSLSLSPFSILFLFCLLIIHFVFSFTFIHFLRSPIYYY